MKIIVEMNDVEMSDITRRLYGSPLDGASGIPCVTNYLASVMHIPFGDVEIKCGFSPMTKPQREMFITEIKAELAHGMRVDAIKRTRRYTECGLKEAYDFIIQPECWDEFIDTGKLPPAIPAFEST